MVRLDPPTKAAIGPLPHGGMWRHQRIPQLVTPRFYASIVSCLLCVIAYWKLQSIYWMLISIS